MQTPADDGRANTIARHRIATPQSLTICRNKKSITTSTYARIRHIHTLGNRDAVHHKRTSIHRMHDALLASAATSTSGARFALTDLEVPDRIIRGVRTIFPRRFQPSCPRE
eukprot:7441618-Pyramimonas_sp.AAC.1